MVLVRGPDPEPGLNMAMRLSYLFYDGALHVCSSNLDEVPAVALTALPRVRPVVLVHGEL